MKMNGRDVRINQLESSLMEAEAKLKKSEENVVRLENTIKMILENSKRDDERKNRPSFTNCTIHAQEMNFK